jgi:hypothetical protein
MAVAVWVSFRSVSALQRQIYTKIKPDVHGVVAHLQIIRKWLLNVANGRGAGLDQMPIGERRTGGLAGVIGQTVAYSAGRCG